MIRCKGKAGTAARPDPGSERNAQADVQKVRESCPPHEGRCTCRQAERCKAEAAFGRQPADRQAGDAPVQAYIAAMPGWKREVGRRFDALVVRTVPGVRRAVRWNSPFYGVEAPGGTVSWFLGVHCITKYVKIAFFKGAALRPLPPVESKQQDVRYFHIHEHDTLDEALVASWIKQASEQPGWIL